MGKASAVLALASSLGLAGCAHAPRRPAPAGKARPPSETRSPQPQAKAVDAAAQKTAYDLGMKCFSEEKYAEAAQAWQEAVRQGPSTPLGRKSQENLRKTNQMLKTLQEIEKQ
jgi:TolA-binding protein